MRSSFFTFPNLEENGVELSLGNTIGDTAPLPVSIVPRVTPVSTTAAPVVLQAIVAPVLAQAVIAPVIIPAVIVPTGGPVTPPERKFVKPTTEKIITSRGRKFDSFKTLPQADCIDEYMDAGDRVYPEPEDETSISDDAETANNELNRLLKLLLDEKGDNLPVEKWLEFKKKHYQEYRNSEFKQQFDSWRVKEMKLANDELALIKNVCEQAQLQARLEYEYKKLKRKTHKVKNRQDFFQAQTKFVALMTKLPLRLKLKDNDFDAWVKWDNHQHLRFESYANAQDFFAKWCRDTIGLRFDEYRMLCRLEEMQKTIERCQFITDDLDEESKILKQKTPAVTERNDRNNKRKEPVTVSAPKEKKPRQEEKVATMNHSMDEEMVFKAIAPKVPRAHYELLGADQNYVALLNLIMSPKTIRDDVVAFFQQHSNLRFKDLPYSGQLLESTQMLPEQESRLAEYGFTPLMFAAGYCKNAEVIMSLLQFMNTEVEVKNKYDDSYKNLTALEIAKEVGNKVFVDCYAKQFAAATSSSTAHSMMSLNINIQVPTDQPSTLTVVVTPPAPTATSVVAASSSRLGLHGSRKSAAQSAVKDKGETASVALSLR